MRLQDIIPDKIDELSVKKKDPYASGSNHDIYKNLHDPNKVFKVKKGDGEHNTNWIEIFKKFPELFPKVYRDNDKGAEVEKLDAFKAHKEFQSINDAIPKEIGSFEGLLVSMTRKSSKGDLDQEIRELHGYLADNDPDLVGPFLRYVKLIGSIVKKTNLEFIDAHAANFGYDKNGKLKMLDI